MNQISSKRIVGMVAAATAMIAMNHCTSARGELVVTATTDMSLPKDIDAIQLVVISRGQTQFSNKYQVGNGQLLVPATMGLLPGADPSQPVTVRIIAWKGTSPVVLRETITTVPTTRIANLHLPIEGLSAGSATTSGAIDPTTGDVEVSNACADGMTAVQGVCVDEHVEESSLPDYEAASVFGGGDGNGSGACFDTVSCMSTVQTLTVNPDCSFQMPDGLDSTHVNFALASSNGVGICIGNPSDLTSNVGPCYLVLDFDKNDGWSNSQLPQGTPLGGTLSDAGTDASSCSAAGSQCDTNAICCSGLCLNGFCSQGEGQPDAGGTCSSDAPCQDAGTSTGGGSTYYLPPGVCAQIQSGHFSSVVYSTSCASKTVGVPSCGPWSSVGGNGGGGKGDDGGGSVGPADASGGFPDSGTRNDDAGLPNGDAGTQPSDQCSTCALPALQGAQCSDDFGVCGTPATIFQSCEQGCNGVISCEIQCFQSLASACPTLESCVCAAGCQSPCMVECGQ